MNVAIVTTTINPPTKALLKYLEIARAKNWQLYIVADQKTPHAEYERIIVENDHVHYLYPSDQENISIELSDLIGWNCIQRRNFGFLAALKDGADIIATIDDDNIPLDSWGDNIYVGRSISAPIAQTGTKVFDPLSLAQTDLWHRGYPVQLLDKRMVYNPIGERIIKPLVQAGLWNGAPDIDAVARINNPDNQNFDHVTDYYSTDRLTPFNSQNTFLSKDIFPTYFLFPHVGRMDDIWAAYHTQSVFGTGIILFTKPTVYQERNPHNLYKDLEAEMLGYKHNLAIVEGGGSVIGYLPEKSLRAYLVYQDIIGKLY